MATTVRAGNTQIDLDTLDRIRSYLLAYHEEEDTLFIRPEPPVPAVSVDVDGMLWLRVDKETGAIVGIEIEDFEKAFLKAHPELRRAWKQAKHSYRRQAKDKYLDESFVQAIWSFMRRLLVSHPQTRFVPAGS